MKKILAIAALAATIGFFGLQAADAQRGQGPMAGGYCWKAMAGQPNGAAMNEETKKAYNGFMEATVELRREMFNKREQMRALRFAENPDQAQIDALAQEMFELRTQIQARAVEAGWQGGAGGPGNGMGMGMGMGCRCGGNGPWGSGY